MLRSLVTRNITAIRTPAAHSKVHTCLQPSRSLFMQSSFFTSHSTKKVTASILKREWRTYIRPHYYQNRQSLSEARRQQQNPFSRLVRNINNQSPEKLSWTIIGVNLAVFVTWQYAEGSYRQFGDGSWIVFMRDNFMTSLQNIREGRIYTLLTSSVSHSNMPHFLVNMVVLQSIAAPLIATLNPSRFLLFYAGSAVVSSLASLGYVKFVRPHLHKTYRFNSAEPVSSLGASGVLMAAMTFYGLAFPQTRFLLFFVIPMPALSVIGAVALYDLYNAYTQRVGIVDSAAHLGGVAYGAGYWFLRVRPLLRAGRWHL